MTGFYLLDYRYGSQELAGFHFFCGSQVKLGFHDLFDSQLAYDFRFPYSSQTECGFHSVNFTGNGIINDLPFVSFSRSGKTCFFTI